MEDAVGHNRDSDRRIAEMLYSPEFLRKMDEATLRLEAKDSPDFGPTGECPCGGILMYLLRQGVHYCALCDTEYPDNNGTPMIGGSND